ncbi:hypothetical protein [Mucilaginibacter boryungensis]|uniref:Uncharacterized protein n=1 Tax=Mucilaginibacter boryungensis TaxID=768480 RepID=A0ABR9XN43_9SPHI|nr:hypothetical protein [Mucilaginibacter boryungensis]MBE9668716.1 hypothetical protein [Mucilaginibacter boryungensis]
MSDIEPYKSTGIPTNSITHKIVPGCGITTYEIRYAKHRSIIILPNVPVIKSKVEEHNKMFTDQQILGVYKGIDVDDIKVYLLKPGNYKKILTTPEGFISKVMKAFDGQLESLYADWFLLYDECERIITDISYRGAIAAPLDLFFRFKNKALVSATTLPFSDDRFKEFVNYFIQPEFDYSQPLTVLSTNNVIASLKAKLDDLQSETVCIFINSTKGIHAIIETLAIKYESKVFCGNESVVKLMELGYMNASSEFSVKQMGRYNFFTSRYFSAFDILLNHKPDVIMISDIIFADHSILDPHTEVIQIAGRFRKGVTSLTHITNYDPFLAVMDEHEASNYLNGCLDTYEHILMLFKKAKHKASKETLEFFVKNSPIASFFTEGKRNNFMIDNDLNEERVKNYYVSSDRLKEAYTEVSDHFNITHATEEYVVGDNDFRRLSRQPTKKDKWRQVAMLMDRYTAKPGGAILLTPDLAQIKATLYRNYPLIGEAYNLLGLHGLEGTEYIRETIQAAIKAAKAHNIIVAAAPFVQSRFSEYTTVPESKIVDELTAIYKKQGITYRVSAAHILRYFEGKRSQISKENVYILTTKKTFEAKRYGMTIKISG